MITLDNYFSSGQSQILKYIDMKQLTIIPRARMGSESIAHEAEGQMGYWLRGHEGERNNCFSKIQLAGYLGRRKNKTSLRTAAPFPKEKSE